MIEKFDGGLLRDVDKNWKIKLACITKQQQNLIETGFVRPENRTFEGFL